MAYMNQSEKARLAPKVKAVLKKYNMKGSLAVSNYSTLVLNLKSGPLNLADNDRGYSQVNLYWLADSYQGKELAFLQEIKTAMNDGNHDTSNAQIDYFCVGWYVNVNAGHWNKPYRRVA